MLTKFAIILVGGFLIACVLNAIPEIYSRIKNKIEEIRKTNNDTLR